LSVNCGSIYILCQDSAYGAKKDDQVISNVEVEMKTANIPVRIESQMRSTKPYSTNVVLVLMYLERF